MLQYGKRFASARSQIVIRSPRLCRGMNHGQPTTFRSPRAEPGARCRMKQSKPAMNPPSATRFNMKSLLGLMVMVSLVAALAGAHVRRVDERAQWYLAAYWMSVLTCVLLILLSQLVRRRFAERKAGVVRYTVPCMQVEPAGYHMPRWGVVCVLLVYAFISWNIGNDVVDRVLDGESLLSELDVAFLLSLPVGLVIRNCWWQREVWLCQNGFVWEHRFIPWPQVNCWYHSKRDDGAIELRTRKGLGTFDLELTQLGEQSQEMIEFLNQIVGPSGQSKE